MLAEAPADREEVLVAEVDLAHRRDPPRLAVLRDRRIDAYEGLTRRFLDEPLRRTHKDLRPIMSPRAAKPTPASLGFAMPAEWDRTRPRGWPGRTTGDWPGKMEAVAWVFGEMVRKIAPGEVVRIMVQGDRPRGGRPAACSRRPRPTLANIEFHRWPTNRAWIRDFGPIGVRRGAATPEVAVAKFKFTAWGYKHPNWHRDNQVPLQAAEALGLRLFPARVRGRDFALEGGGIDVNGRGTLLTTEECFLHPTIQVRNPGAARQDYEAVFRDYLGAANTLWLGRRHRGRRHPRPRGRPVPLRQPDTVVLVQESNPRDVNYRPLRGEPRAAAGMRLEDGSKVEVVELPCPAPLYHGDQRLPASYANFYISNAAVLVPTFNDPQDRRALGILAELFPGRTVVGIHAVDLVLGFGTLHCLTQQHPAAR